MNRRLSRSYFLGGVSALGASSLGAPASAVAPATEYTMRVSTVTDAASAEGLALVKFAAAVYHRSNGQLTIEVYPNSQLAKESEIVSGLVSGVIDFCGTASTILLPVAPRFQIFNLPLLFRSLAGANRVFDGSIGAELFADLEAKGIAGLTWGGGGFRDLQTTTKPILVPEDMRGLRIRIQNDPISVATYQALGAVPVSIEPAEIFLALQQHTIDGTDLSIDAIVTKKLYTLLKHMGQLHQMLSVLIIIGSKRKIDALPAALQKIIKDEAKAAAAPWRLAIAQQTIEEIQVLKQNGCTFTEPQYSAFRKAVEPAYALVQSKLGVDWIERVSRVANTA